MCRLTGDKITDTADLKEELNLDQSDRSKLTAALSKVHIIGQSMCSQVH